MQIINPATEQIISEISEDTEETLRGKFQILQNHQQQWQRTPIVERAEILKRFADLLVRRTDNLAATLTAEVGKPLQQSVNEIQGARNRVLWLTENASKYLSPEIMNQQEGLEEKIIYEPLGVICNISAWNYPYLVGMNVFVPALLAGNSVMYKPSEFATLSGLEIGKLLVEAGVPEAVFQVAVGGKQVGEYLLDISFNGYFFTGSYKTGKYIYERVASKMVPCQCELGGKDPLYVAEDVNDIRSVAAATADGAFYNTGQSCCAVERIYVHEKIYDQYLENFKNEVQAYKLGSPNEPGTYIGPLTRKDQLEVLQKQVEDALSKGATLLTGGNTENRTGYFYQPTILTNVNHQMDIMNEESFGPVIGIMKVKDDEQAIELMQDTQYGLTAAVYSSNKDRAQRILENVDAGTGYWNCCDRVSPAVPWSGRKKSGFGATLSHIGLRAFTKPKALQFRY